MIFVLYAHGAEFYSKQAYLAARSIMARQPSARAVIYTPYALADPQLDVRQISRFELESWRGALAFHHRMKMCMLIRAHLELGDDTPFCFIDADMYCRTMPAELMNPGGKALFFENEGPVGTSFHCRLHDFFIERREELAGAGYGALQPNLAMYNSGLVYLPPGAERLRVFEEVLRLTDFLCLRFPQQMTWLEQTAFSHIVPLHYDVATPKAGFEHYWKCNSEMARLLENMSLADINAIAVEESRFAELLLRAKAMRRQYDNKLRQTIRNWKGSLRKRLTVIKARKLIGTS